MSILSAPFFHDEAAAFAYLEEVLWAGEPVCPHCGAIGRVYALEGVKDKKGRVRLGLKKCGACRKQFTIRVGTVFESAHIPLHKCLQATYLLTSSKKGFSAHQLHRVLGITYKSAWFLFHRIREAMRTGALAPMGGAGSVVEIDETFIGRKPGRSKRRGYAHKMAVLTLVERGGQSRSFHVDQTSAKALVPILKANIARETKIMSDEAGQYHYLKKAFAEHHVVSHGKGEYVRGEAHTNTAEGFFSVFKRGMKGVYQHCGEQHLHRYLAEFDFRYNNRTAVGVDDSGRTKKALRGISGKRLTYQTTR